MIHISRILSITAVLLSFGTVSCASHQAAQPSPFDPPTPPLNVACATEMATELAWLEAHSNAIGRSTLTDFQPGPIDTGGGWCGHYLRRGLRAFQQTIGHAMVGTPGQVLRSKKQSWHELTSAYSECEDEEVRGHIQTTLALMVSAVGELPEELQTTPPHTCTRVSSATVEVGLTTLLEYDRLLNPDE